MKKHYPCLVVVALLVACSGKSASVATEANPMQRQPGNWQMVATTVAFDAENVSGGMAEMVAAGQSSIGKKDVSEPVCLTAVDVGKDDLMVRLGEVIQFGPEWKVIRSGSKDGHVDFAAVMDDPQQGKGEMTITGRITPTATVLTLTTDSRQPPPGKGHIHTVMKQENHRVGECVNAAAAGH